MKNYKRKMVSGSERFMNPCLDYSFKRIFGQEQTKFLLIDFLNNLLVDEDHIVDVKYQDKEQIPEDSENRTLIYDIYCKTDDGRWIIVEMQNKVQSYFLQRSLVYTANAMLKQTRKGDDWQYDIKAVYFIAFMNEADPSIGNEYRTDVILYNETEKKRFTNLVRLIYLQLPLFNLKEEDCDTFFKKWIYVLTNMDILGNLPKEFQCEAFNMLKDVSDISMLTEKERNRYEAVREAYRNTMCTYDAAIKKGEQRGFEVGQERGLARGLEKGLAEGLEKGRIEGLEKGRAEGVEIGEKRGQDIANKNNARIMKGKGLSFELISEVTGLSIEEIESI